MLTTQGVQIDLEPGRGAIEGDLGCPPEAVGTVLFAHGSGSSRHSPRNRLVASRLHREGLATLLMDLLTPEEEEVDRVSAHLRFDIGLLAARLLAAADWLSRHRTALGVPPGVGYFGGSTGAAAALIAAARRPEAVRAVVSRGGRPDLAWDSLPAVQCPTLLVVGEHDPVVINLNQRALERLRCPRQLIIVPRATHLFEEAGALEQVADIAAWWFAAHIPTE